MIPKAAEVRLTPEDRAVLEARLRAPTTEQRDVLRARIVLLAAEGRSTQSIASTVGTMPRTVSLWRGRFARQGLAGLGDKPRPGRAPKYGARDGAAYSGGIGAATAGRICTLDGTADCGRTGQCARAASLALSACPEDRPFRAQVLV
jgi:hypothetical protein